MKEKEICWNITARCNQNCKYCHRFQNPKDLSFEDNNRILDNLIASGVKNITWTGGEALLVNGIDELHRGAVFFEGSNGTVIEYYNVTSEFSSIYQINNERISAAQASNGFINTIQPIQLDGKNVSNVIIADNGGNFTRYVSLLSNGNLYVFKITGNSINTTTSSEIESVLNSVHIG